MKTILVNYTGRLGGGPMYAWEMTRALLQNGNEVCAVISKYVQNLDDWKKLPLRKLVILDTYTTKAGFLRAMAKFPFCEGRRIKEEWKGISFDYIYCPMYAWLSFYINRLFPKARRILTLHDPIPHSGASFIANKVLNGVMLDHDIAKAHRIVILSSTFKEYIKTRYGKRDAEVLVIPHGVFSTYKSIGARSVVSYDANRINFVFFGRIEQYKGVGVLLSAYKRLEMEYPEKVSLTVAGRGDFSPYQALYDTLQQATLINRWVDDAEVDGFFQGDHVVTVLPYLDATQSGVVNIAMQNRSLILASDTGGLSEQLGGGAYGVLVPADDAEALFAAMKRVVLDYEGYRAIRQRAYDSLKQLDWNVLARNLLEACE